MIRGVFLLLTVCVAQYCFASPLPSAPHIYVEGSAEIEVVPDVVMFSISIEHTHLDMAVAKSDVDQRSRQLILLCQSLGLSEKDLVTTTLNVRPSMKYVDGQRVPDGTIVSRRIELKLTDMDLYTKVMSALVEADISELISTRLLVANEKEITDRALSAAFADAKQRAERIARAANQRIGQVYSVSEFMTRDDERYRLVVSRQIQGQAAHSATLASASDNQYQEPFEPGVMIAKAQVFVVFLFK